MNQGIYVWGKNNKAKSVVLTFQSVLLRERVSPEVSHSCLPLSSRSIQTLGRRWISSSAWKEKAEPWGLFDLSVLEESICFCRQTVGQTSILYHVFR